MMSRCLLLLLATLLLSAPATGALVTPLATGPALAAAPDAGATVPLAKPLDAPVGPSFGHEEKLSTARMPTSRPFADNDPDPFAGIPFLDGGDCGTGGDAGWRHDPTPMDGPGSCEGRVGGHDWEDVYSIEVDGPRILGAGIAVTGPSVGYVCVYHNMSDFYRTLRCDDGREGAPAHTATYVATPGTWHVLVESSEELSYGLTVEIHGWETPGDCGDADAPDARDDGAFSLAGACVASLDPETDRTDWYALHVGAGEAVTLTVAPNRGLDADVCVYDAAHLVDCSIRPVGDVDRILLQPSEARDYLVKVYWWDGAGTYDVRAEPAALQDDCGSGADHGTRYVPAAIALPVACVASLDPNAGDSWDSFSMVLPDRGVRVRLDAPADGLVACLYESRSGWPVRCTSGQAGASTFAYQANVPAASFVVAVFSRTGAAAAYPLFIDPFVPTPQDDCASGRDAGNFPSTAVPLPSDGACSGALLASEGDDSDGVTFAVPPSTVRASVRGTSAEFHACLHLPLGNGRSSTHCHYTESGEIDFDVQVRYAGNVTIHVESRRSDDLAYEMEATVSAPYSDCGTGGDAHSRDEGTPPRLEPPVLRCEGKLFTRSYDLTDEYVIHAQAGQTIQVAVEVAEGLLWSACIEGNQTRACGLGTFPLGAPAVIAIPVVETGDYVIALEGASFGAVTYRMSVLVQ